MVYRGQDLVTSEEVALKIIKLAMEVGIPSTAIREISILLRIIQGDTQSHSSLSCWSM
jgi:hypothetical protein